MFEVPPAIEDRVPEFVCEEPIVNLVVPATSPITYKLFDPTFASVTQVPTTILLS